MSVAPNISNRRALADLNDDGDVIEPGSWEVISEGKGGFDRVTRPDYFSARGAAKTHKRATDNDCEINPIYE